MVHLDYADLYAGRSDQAAQTVRTVTPTVLVGPQLKPTYRAHRNGHVMPATPIQS